MFPSHKILSEKTQRLVAERAEQFHTKLFQFPTKPGQEAGTHPVDESGWMDVLLSRRQGGTGGHGREDIKEAEVREQLTTLVSPYRQTAFVFAMVTGWGWIERLSTAACPSSWTRSVPLTSTLPSEQNYNFLQHRNLSLYFTAELQPVSILMMCGGNVFVLGYLKAAEQLVN